jgi:predicted  nucleic acid-binding Zn-ribbon protein
MPLAAAPPAVAPRVKHQASWGVVTVFRPWLFASLSLSALANAAAQAPQLSTKDEYLACLKAQSAIEARKASLQDRDRGLKERAAKFQWAEADLNAQVRKHPPATQKEIESYNKAIALRNASAASLNKASASLLEEQAALNKRIIEVNSSCGALVVSTEDAQAAEEEYRRGSRAQ